MDVRLCIHENKKSTVDHFSAEIKKSGMEILISFLQERKFMFLSCFTITFLISNTHFIYTLSKKVHETKSIGQKKPVENQYHIQSSMHVRWFCVQIL